MTRARSTRRTLGSLVLVVAACTAGYQARFQPSLAPAAHVVEPVDAGGVALAVPTAGSAQAETLRDGWPVWVVHHDDGTVTVIDAVCSAPAALPRPGPSVLPEAKLVTWIPGVRRFVAGNVLYDEHGRALGYRDFDACMDDCPRIEDRPRMLDDLDTFEARAGAAPDTVIVGSLRRGGTHEAAPKWLPWRRPAAREQDMHDADLLPWTQPIATARTRPPGSYAIVAGNVVRSTSAPPVLCEVPANTPGCGVCGAASLPVAGLAAVVAAAPDAPRARYVDAQTASFLVRRDATAVTLVAVGAYQGTCGGEM